MIVSKNNNSSFTAGAVFSGIGGFCDGFSQAGITTLWAIEKDLNAVSTYRNNHPGIDVVRYKDGHPNEGLPKDIHDVSVAQDKLEPVDVLTAGFPCQSFSQAGNRKGFEDERGQLFFELMRLIKEFGSDRPRLLIFENVPYLKVGNGGAWFAKVKFEIQSAGYWFNDTNAQILDPLALGILPQRRERLFMVAASINDFKSNKFTFPDGTEENVPDVRTFINLKKEVDERYYLDPDNRYFEELMKVLKTKPEGCLVQYRKYYTRDIQEGICPTLTANMGQGGHNVPFLRQGDRIRKLTETECAIIQGFEGILFPDDVASTCRYTQIGNSVVVPIAKLLAEQVKEKLSME